jgi:hypothetical protein
VKLNDASPILISQVAGIEPEEQATGQVLATSSPIKVGRDPWDPEARIYERELSTHVNVELSAGELAQNRATCCASCAFFRPDHLKKLISKWEEPTNHEGRIELERVRGAFTDNRPGDGRFVNLDQVDTLLKECGICEAITEIVQYPLIVTPIGGCPAERGPKGEDLSQLYRVKDREARRASSKTFDQIMFTAAGRLS